MTDEAEAEIRELSSRCNAREPQLPAPTMKRCWYAKGHTGPHSWNVSTQEPER